MNARIAFSQRTWQPVREPLVGHTAFIMNVAFSPDGTRAGLRGRRQTVRLWEVSSGTAVRRTAHRPHGVLDGSRSAPTAASWRRRAATARCGCGMRPAAENWAAAHGPHGLRQARGVQPRRHQARLGRWRRHGAAVGCGQRSADRRPLTAHEDEVSSVAFSADGTRLASVGVVDFGSAGGRGTVRQMGGNERSADRRADIASRWVSVAALNADGTRLAGGDGPAIRLWDVPTGRRSVSRCPDLRPLTRSRSVPTAAGWPRATPMGRRGCGTCPVVGRSASRSPATHTTSRPWRSVPTAASSRPPATI